MIGLAHPLRIGLDGSLAIVEDEAVIRTHLAQIAGTNGSGPRARAGQGELPWAPEFGGNVDYLRFAPLGSLINEAITARVVGSAAEWEPRARITGVVASSDERTNTSSLVLTFGSPQQPRDQVRVQR